MHQQLSSLSLKVVTVALLASACGGGTLPPVARHMGGQRIVGSFVSPYSYEWFVRGELALARGDLGEAAEAFEMARAGPEEDPLVLARLAEVLDRLERTDDADRVLEDGLASFPDSEALWLAGAQIAAGRGDTEEAIAAYRRAMAVAPGSEHGPVALSRLLKDQGAAGRAEELLESFLRTNPDGVAALRARLELALGRGDADANARSIEELLRVAPARAGEVIQAAETLFEAGRPALAARVLSAVPKRSVDPQLLLRVLIAAGHRDRAEALLGTLPVESLGGALARARFFLLVGRPRRAREIAELEGALQASPEAALIEGLARLEQGEAGTAAERLMDVPRDASGYPEAQAALIRCLEGQGLEGLASEIRAQ